MVDELNDVRIIGVITAVALLSIAMIGMAWEARVSRCRQLKLQERGVEV